MKTLDLPPLPRTIAAQIEAHVDKLDLLPGDRIPTEDRLREAMGLTRHQLRKGLAFLKQNKGWIQLQGSGTYLPGGSKKRRPKEKTIVIAGPWPRSLLADFDECQQMAMAKGYCAMVINAGTDPHVEKTCLQAIKERHVTALCLEPTPIPPWNLEMVDQFLADGIKVALFNAPPESRNRYNLFRLDYRKAGSLGVSYLLKQGVRKMVLISSLVKGHDYPWQHMDFRDGVRETAADLGLPLEETPALSKLNTEREELEWRQVDGQIPFEEGLGYICDHYSAAQLVRRQARAAGIVRAEFFATYTSRINLPFAYALMDDQERLRRMMAYALDSRIPPHKRVGEVVAPIIVPPSSQESA